MSRHRPSGAGMACSGNSARRSCRARARSTSSSRLSSKGERPQAPHLTPALAVVLLLEPPEPQREASNPRPPSWCQHSRSSYENLLTLVTFASGSGGCARPAAWGDVPVGRAVTSACYCLAMSSVDDEAPSRRNAAWWARPRPTGCHASIKLAARRGL